MVLECPACHKIDEQKKVGEYVFECQFCKHLYKKEQAVLRLEDEDIKIIDNKDDVIQNLPSELVDSYLKLETQKQKFIIYKIATDMSQQDIAYKLQVTEATMSHWNKNKLIRDIIDYFKREQIKEVRQKTISKTVELTNFCLDELQKEIKGLTGKEKIAAIKVALEYDSKNKINTDYNNDALNTSLL